jgi:hypothetical protein
MNDLYITSQTSIQETPFEVEIMVSDHDLKSDLEGTTRRFGERYKEEMDKRQSNKYINDQKR